MANELIEILSVEEPLLAGHPVMFVGPAAWSWGHTVQFFVVGGTISTWSAAHIMLTEYFNSDYTKFDMRRDTGKTGVCTVIDDSTTRLLHGDVY